MFAVKNVLLVFLPVKKLVPVKDNSLNSY